MQLVEAAPGTPTPRAVRDAAPSPARSMLPFFCFAAACYLVAPYLGVDSRDVDPRISELWPPGGVGFVLLSTVWHAGPRLVLPTAAFMFSVFLVTAAVVGDTVAYGAWIGALAVLQSVLMLVIYRRLLSHDGWAPETPNDIAGLLFAAVGSSLVAGLLGGFPGLPIQDSLDDQVLLWWVLRNTVFCFVGATTFMVIFFQRHREVLPPSPWYNRVGLLTISITCVYGTYVDPTLPLSWLLMIPCVWGGLTLTIRGTAYLSLTVALCAAAMTYLPQNKFDYSGFMPAASIVDLLVIASVAFAFLLTLMRDQRARLILELDSRRAESEGQRQLLETVFESMNDGVMVVAERGVTKYNQAARRLLGKPIPRGPGHAWATAYDISTTDGRQCSDEELSAALLPEDGLPARIEVVVNGEGGAKVLDVESVGLGSGAEESRLLLLHDSTDQRARVRELTNFAGMVAHDLRGPLTVLDGWLEVLQDGSARGTEMGDEVAGKAKDASRRMRQVIEDWLGYTVVQNGKPSPEPVKLVDAVGEIFESRRGGESEEPIFTHDVEHAVFADPRLLRQLLDNLVGNAVKYTSPEFTPRVHVVSQRDDEPGWIRIDVVDNGIGIPEGEEEQIFEEFHRGGTEGRSAGTGLGLALTRRIVALHGGQLSARRNPAGCGSTFTFTLPAA